mgnify:CR=1 FL=1
MYVKNMRQVEKYFLFASFVYMKFLCVKVAQVVHLPAYYRKLLKSRGTFHLCLMDSSFSNS